MYECKACNRAASRARYERNRDDRLATMRAYEERTRDERQLKRRATYRRNRDRLLAEKRVRYQADPERYREAMRLHRLKNPEYGVAYNRARRARLRHAVPQRWRLSPHAPDLCYWCGLPLTDDTLQIDHVMPTSKGGPATPQNEVPSCEPCNQSKKAKHPLVWLASHF